MPQSPAESGPRAHEPWQVRRARWELASRLKREGQTLGAIGAQMKPPSGREAVRKLLAQSPPGPPMSPEERDLRRRERELVSMIAKWNLRTVTKATTRRLDSYTAELAMVRQKLREVAATRSA